MKKSLSVLLLLTLCGCASINIPNYIQDKHPNKQTFYASYDRTYAATVKALNESGWVIESETDPAIFERGRQLTDTSRAQTLIFTKIRQFSFFLGSYYARLNVFVDVTADKATEVEVRYLKITSILFKTFRNYKNDKVTGRVLKSIEKELNL